MLSWEARSGFHVHVETRVDPEDRDRLRTLLRYLTRAPVALEPMPYVERTGQVTYRTRKGAELHYLHAVDFLADLSQHIPPPRRQMVSYHGEFANALGRLESRAPAVPDPPAAPPRPAGSRPPPGHPATPRAWPPGPAGGPPGPRVVAA